MRNQKPYSMHTLLNYIRGVYKALEMEWIKIAKELDLTTAELHVIWVIDQEEPVTMSEIARIGLWDVSTVMAMVKRLKQKGLVSVKKSEKDKRVSYVLLEESGKEKKRLSAKLPKCKFEEYFDQMWDRGEEDQHLVEGFLHFSKRLNEQFHNQAFTEWVDLYKNPSRITRQ